MERNARLRKGEQFDSVYARGTVIGGPLVVVRHLPNEAGVTRWGFAVGKGLARQATLRNRTRRRLRAVADHLQVRPGIDIVVTARTGAIDAPYGSLSEALRRALERGGLLADGRVP